MSTFIQQLREMDANAEPGPWEAGPMWELFPETRHNPILRDQWGCVYPDKSFMTGGEWDAKCKAFLRNNLAKIITLLEIADEMQLAIQAFQDPEDNMPEDTGEFRDLKKALDAYTAAKGGGQ